jgi:hypothetical protein
MKRLMWLLAVAPVLLIACGEGDTTTVVQQPDSAETTTVTTPAPAPAPAPAAKAAPAPAPAPEPAGCQNPPDVVGLALPQAKAQLAAAGCGASVSNTDTTFGIIVPRNYTVCTQDDPIGTRVPILAQKYGC